MTTEAIFAAALDADPADWQTRLVFADWLLEQGDMRWEGMQWLGTQRKWPGSLGWWGKDHSEMPWGLPVESQVLKDLNLFFVYLTRAKAENAFLRAYPALAAAHPAEFAVGVMA